MGKSKCGIPTKTDIKIAEELNVSPAIVHSSREVVTNNFKLTGIEYKQKDINDAIRTSIKNTIEVDKQLKPVKSKLSNVYKILNALLRKKATAIMVRYFRNSLDFNISEKISQILKQLESPNLTSGQESILNHQLSELMSLQRSKALILGNGGLSSIINEIHDTFLEYLDMSEDDKLEDLQYQFGLKDISPVKDKFLKVIQYRTNFYKTILDNFDYFVDQMGAELKLIDGISIMARDNKVQYKKNDDDKEIDREDPADNGVMKNPDDKKENWMFSDVNTNPFNTASKKVKQFISTVVKMRQNPNGEFARDKRGNLIIDYDELLEPQYLETSYVYNCMLSEFQNVFSSDDFDNQFLKNLLTKYPWAVSFNDVFDKDSENYDPQLKALFYKTFRKRAIEYAIIKNDSFVVINRSLSTENMYRNLVLERETGNYDKKSIFYTLNRKLNVNEILLQCQLIFDLLERKLDINPSAIVDILKRIGITGITTDVINSLALKGMYNIDNLITYVSYLCNTIKKVNNNIDIIERCKSDYLQILEPLSYVMPEAVIPNIKRNGKNYYSYTFPNYISDMFSLLKNLPKEKFDLFIEDHFGKYDYFYYEDKDGKHFYNQWIEDLINNPTLRRGLALSTILSIDDKKYADWDDKLIMEKQIKLFFSGIENSKGENKYARYIVPIYADSTNCDIVRFKVYTNDEIFDNFKNMVIQEIKTISEVHKRGEQILDAIKYDQELPFSPIIFFDMEFKDGKEVKPKPNDFAGSKFNFLPELNDYEVKDGVSFYEQYQKYLKNKSYGKAEKLLTLAISDILNAKCVKFKQNYSDLLEFKGKSLADIANFYLNSYYANCSIIQMLILSPAFNKNSVDLLKRFKEVVASGDRCYTNAEYKDPETGLITDYNIKKLKVIYIKDSTNTSRMLDKIKDILDDMVKNNRISSYERDDILYKYSSIAQTDGLAFRTLPSMSKVLNMLGEESFKKAVENFENNTWNATDFNVVFRTLKPFIYSIVDKPSNVDGRTDIGVPTLIKDSEFALTTIYQLINNSLGKSPKMKALNQFMVDHNIDCAVYESAVKSGLNGAIAIDYNNDTVFEDGIKINDNVSYKTVTSIDGNEKTSLKNQLLDSLKKGDITQNEFNDTLELFEMSYDDVYNTLSNYTRISNDHTEGDPSYVQTIDMKDYMIASETTAHLLDETTTVGSQFKKLILINLPDDFSININGKQFNKLELLSHIQDLLASSPTRGYKKLKKDLSSINKLSKIIEDQIETNPKYGEDLKNSIKTKIVDGTNELTTQIPLSDRSVSLQLLPLLNSLFKNRITKQEMNGSSCILVSSVGYTKELNVVYNDDHTIKYIECYMPASSSEFFSFLKDGSGIFDYSKMPEEAKKILAIRFPTEEKCSMFPLYIKGFLPQQNSSAIMLPQDPVVQSGFDFDVDKLFIMQPSFNVYTNEQNMRYDFVKQNHYKEFALLFNNYKSNSKQIEDIVNDYIQKDLYPKIDINNVQQKDLINPINYYLSLKYKDEYDAFLNDHKNDYNYKSFKKIKYDHSVSALENSKQACDNEFLDTAYNILTATGLAGQMINPSNYVELKRCLKIIKIVESGKYKQDDLVKLSDKKLNDIYEKLGLDNQNVNIFEPDAFGYYHGLNMIGRKILAITASYSALYAQMLGKDVHFDSPIYIGDHKIYSLTEMYDEDGKFISKNNELFLAAAADNAKDPVLKDIGLTVENSPITGFMLRMGLSPLHILLILKLGFCNNNIPIKIENKDYGEGKDILSKNNLLTIDNLIKTIRGDKDINIDGVRRELMYLHNFIVTTNNLMQNFYKIAKADSPTNAVAATFAGQTIQLMKIDKYARQKGFIKGLDNIITPRLLESDTSVDDMYKTSIIPSLLAYTTFGIEGPSRLLGRYFIEYSPGFLKLASLYDNIYEKENIQEKDLNNLWNEFSAFLMSRTQLFGNEKDENGNIVKTLDEKRSYYLLDFPKELFNRISKYPELKNNIFIRRLSLNNLLGMQYIALDNALKMTLITRDNITNAFSLLIYSDNAEVRKTVLDLIKYFYYANNYKPSMYDIMPFVSTNIKMSIPELSEGLINSFNDMHTDIKSNDLIERFILQRLLLDIDNLNVVTISATNNDTVYLNKNNTGKLDPAMYVYGTTFDKKQYFLYKLVESNEKYNVYLKVGEVHNTPGIFERYFDANKDIIETNFNEKVNNLIEKYNQTLKEKEDLIQQGINERKKAKEEKQNLNVNNTEQVNTDYEVSSKGDKRFSALYATFDKGTFIKDPNEKSKKIDIGGMTIEQVYQTILKNSKKGLPPSENSYLNTATSNSGYNIFEDNGINYLKSKYNSKEDYSYYKGYLPLWKLWADQHPELINELENITKNNKLKDSFAKTSVNQARALTDIINMRNNTSAREQQIYTNHSGGANGADSYWQNIGEKYGVKTNAYYSGEKTPQGNIEISKEDYDEGRYEAAKAAKRNYGYNYSTMKNDLLIRNWSQVKHADSIFAISNIVGKGEKIFPDQKNDTRVAAAPSVTGGTGYAVGMAINHWKPVYVYNQGKIKNSYERGWYKYNQATKDFVKTDIPVLTKNFAGIGSRNISKEDVDQIIKVYEKTFGENNISQSQNTNELLLNVLTQKQDNTEYDEPTIEDLSDVIGDIDVDEKLKEINEMKMEMAGMTEEDILNAQNGMEKETKANENYKTADNKPLCK